MNDLHISWREFVISGKLSVKIIPRFRLLFFAPRSLQALSCPFLPLPTYRSPRYLWSIQECQRGMRAVVRRIGKDTFFSTPVLTLSALLVLKLLPHAPPPRPPPPASQQILPSPLPEKNPLPSTLRKRPPSPRVPSPLRKMSSYSCHPIYGKPGRERRDEKGENPPFLLNFCPPLPPKLQQQGGRGILKPRWAIGAG